MSQIKISKIELSEVLPLRQKLLKPFLTIPECRNPGDSQAGTFHLGAFHEGVLVGVASFEIESSPLLQQPGPWARLRGMGVGSNQRRLGIGRSLVLAGESILREQQFQGLWFNARLAAFDFYLSLDYQFIGEMFELPQIGPHKVMYKHWGHS